MLRGRLKTAFVSFSYLIRISFEVAKSGYVASALASVTYLQMALRSVFFRKVMFLCADAVARWTGIFWQ